MGVRVNTNVDAFEAQRNMGLVSMDFSKAVQRLSSGLRMRRCVLANCWAITIAAPRCPETKRRSQSHVRSHRLRCAHRA